MLLYLIIVLLSGSHVWGLEGSARDFVAQTAFD